MVMKYAEVILPLALPKQLTYTIPDRLPEEVQVGSRVEVQLGKRKIYSAIVARLTNEKPDGYSTKTILSVLDSAPVVTPQQLEFWYWMAEYYMCTVGEVLAAAMPAGLKLSSETRILIHPQLDNDFSQLDGELFTLAEALFNNKALTIEQVQLILQRKSIYRALEQLVELNIAVFEEELVEKYKPKLETYIQLAPHLVDNDEALKTIFDELERKAPRQVQALMGYFMLTNEAAPVVKAALIEKAKTTDAAIQSLVTKGVFIQFKEEISRLAKQDENEKIDHKLSAAQQTAFDALQTGFDEHFVQVLNGATGSGKTVLFIEQIKVALAQGKQVLYLLPEVAITEQITRRLQKVFGDELGVYHHKINSQQRVEIWNAVLQKKYKVLLGARSALFLPFSELGLIIIDEEHDASYKQSDMNPHYQCRDAAIYLAQQQGAQVLMGSATPSIETYFNCEQKKYGLVELKERYSQLAFPHIQLVDARDETKMKLMKGSFTSVLFEAIKQTLAEKKQVLLFQNRRGYAPSLFCGVCGWIPECDHCAVKLTYHKYSDTLKCHYCGFTRRVVTNCPACGNAAMRIQGFGTEKIEDELKLLFPEARVARMDADNVRGKEAHNRIIKSVEEGRVDILVGTQMITKGLDFDHIKLVGVLSADNLMSFPDFRVVERAFQLLTQVGGRGGRKHEQGAVIIQSLNCKYPVLDFVIRHDYEGFYQYELAQRQKFFYPPYCRLIHLRLLHKNAETVIAASNWLKQELDSFLGPRILGPSKPGIDRIKTLYIREFLFKLERKSEYIKEVKTMLQQKIQELKTQSRFKQVQVRIDVDMN